MHHRTHLQRNFRCHLIKYNDFVYFVMQIVFKIVDHVTLVIKIIAIIFQTISFHSLSLWKISRLRMLNSCRRPMSHSKIHISFSSSIVEIQRIARRIISEHASVTCRAFASATSTFRFSTQVSHYCCSSLEYSFVLMQTFKVVRFRRLMVSTC